MRSSFLHFALPDIGETEINEVAEAIRSGWVTTGPKTKQFETEFAATVKAKHAIAVNSCTAAMHLSLEAIGLEAGDIVLTSPYTFAATTEVIRYFNAIPIFIDVEPDTLNIDPNMVAETLYDITQNSSAQHWLPPSLRNQKSKINPPKAIIPIHIGGLPAEMDKIYDIANEYNLSIIEDAAHAFPSKYKKQFIGHGQLSNSDNTDCTCFSFYATKTITTGEGGMITTNNDTIAERCRIMSLHGISKDAWKRYTAEGSWSYEIIAPGYKYNMTDIAAAMGLAQLAKAEPMWRRRHNIAQHYNEAFSVIPELQIPADKADCQHAWHLYILRLNLETLSISRNQFIEELKARNIGCSVHFIPLHLHPYYSQTYGYKPDDFPIAHQEYQREISLPIYSKMNDYDVQYVIDSVLDIVKTNSCNHNYSIPIQMVTDMCP